MNKEIKILPVLYSPFTGKLDSKLYSFGACLKNNDKKEADEFTYKLGKLNLVLIRPIDYNLEALNFLIFRYILLILNFRQVRYTV